MGNQRTFLVSMEICSEYSDIVSVEVNKTELEALKRVIPRVNSQLDSHSIRIHNVVEV